MIPWQLGLIACAATVITQGGTPSEPMRIPAPPSPRTPDLPSIPQLTPEQQRDRESKDAQNLANNGLTVSLVGMATIPAHHATLGRIGGFSSLAHIEGNRFYVASDRPSDPVVYQLSITLTPAGDDDRFALDATVDAAPMTLAHPSKDSEGIALLPDNKGLVVSYEKPPSIAVMRPRQGEAWRCERLDIPESITDEVRGNRAFESVLVRTPESGTEIWAATEAAPQTDGPEATTAAGTRCRVLVFSGKGFPLEEQFVYITEPSPEGPLHISFNSLSEFCPLPDGRFFALERSFTPLSGFNGRLFVLDGSTRTPAHEPGADAPMPELNKAPVANIRELGVTTPGNFEGMALGPTMAALTGDADQKGRLLLLIADDNFGSDGQEGSKIVALRVTGIPGDETEADDE
jgi:hypothetical protein